MNIIKIKETTSTNQYLSELSEKETLLEGTIVVAETQTAGRGLLNNYWESEAGKNITCSLLLYPTFLPVEQHFMLSKVVALGVKNTLDEYTENVSVKWSNDVYVGDKKIAGILIENELTGCEIPQSIVGIGLNVNQKKFLSNAPNPVSLFQLLGKETDLDILLQKIIENIMFWYNLLKNNAINLISVKYFQNLYHRDGCYSYRDKNGIFNAKIQSISPEGYLCLLTETGEKRIYEQKEVVFI